ncbi:methionyl-tRNA formyltransferase [Nevskia sp.]|uniref:methionyl-tRNA formyltransferase n=1 Tax=Nevskia sp. TaxID=1929292 RepID=UPI0025E0EDA2|nr:methionyl-tRNA formyltransferase [Nevskia sp.]
MKLIFAGTPAFAVPALDALHAAGHDILAVLTQPDRPAGRGQKLTASPVATRAEALGLPVHKFLKLDADARAVLAALEPEIMVVVAYGLILPQAALDIPKHGCLNIHASLLPRWRGAAPIARAVEAGDAETGITIMQMEAGLDTGPMLLIEKLPIDAATTAAGLHDALCGLGGRLIVDALARIAAGDLPATVQPEAGVTYAKKLSKEEARIDWSQTAELIARRIRAFNPAPVAWCELDADRVRFWNARALPLPSNAEPGTVLDADSHGLHIATVDGRLVVTELQRPGGKALPASLVCRDWKLAGQRFS